jgi:hypothetical protein
MRPPERGSVIRYAYLWAREEIHGKREAAKERPTLVLAISILEEDGKHRVYGAAITHSPPVKPADAVPLPQNVKHQLGLDGEPAWIVTTELNAFIWPGPDIRPIPGRQPRTFVYGRVPDALLKRVARSFLENRKKQLAAVVTRDA